MARVTHVKRAQQRYEQVPVIDPETGEQKRTPVMKRVKDRETGEVTEVQKTTKTGRPVFMRLTKEDRSKPKEPLRCDFSGCAVDPEPGKILPGQSYKHISPKSGPYGGRQMNRHAEHPTWNVWEYSSSMSARLAEISHNFWRDLDGVESPDDVQSALDSCAEEIRSLAEEKRESASNIEEGFGHPTSASEELEGIADELDGWADEVEQVDIPELPDPEERYFIEDNSGGRHGEDDGYEDETEAQADLDSMIADLTIEGDADDYKIVAETGDEPSENQMDEWREELQDALSIVDEPPV